MRYVGFQSTLSMRRATITESKTVVESHAFQSTLSMRRATNTTMDRQSIYPFQSTLSMRRATVLFHVGSAQVDISIHALHEESDHSVVDCSLPPRFQSTLSMRRATSTDFSSGQSIEYFNPRSP